MPQAPASPVLQVRGLHFGHPGHAPLFDGWSAELMPGVSLLQGDIGSGKTTLLRLLAGEWSGGGDLVLQGRRQADDPAAYRGAVCWFDPRDPRFDALTPGELMEALALQHAALDVAAWQRHLQGFDLLPHRHKTMRMLSTGTRQKAALAVALSAGCALTLLDEPTIGLDAPSVVYLKAALARLHAAFTAPAVAARALLMVCSQDLGAMPLAGTIWSRAPSTTLQGPS